MSNIGTPIYTNFVITKPFIDCTFRQFVRVLIDIDLSQPLHHKVLVERKDFAFFFELDYENRQEYCTYFKVIGYFIENCKIFAFVGEEVLKKEARWIKNHGREKAYVKKDIGNVIEKSKEELLVKEAITEVIQLEKAGVKDTCNAQLVESPIEMPH